MRLLAAGYVFIIIDSTPKVDMYGNEDPSERQSEQNVLQNQYIPIKIYNKYINVLCWWVIAIKLRMSIQRKSENQNQPLAKRLQKYVHGIRYTKSLTNGR